MTARIVVSCDATFDDGRMPCRGTYPTREYHLGDALWEAEQHDWRQVDTPDGVRHYCPAHARIHTLGTNEGTT